MNNRLVWGCSVTLALVLSACGGSDLNSSLSSAGGVRAVNGIADSSGLVLSFNGGSTGSASFGAATANFVAATGSYAATLSSNGDTFSIGNISIADDQLTVVFGTGLISGTHGGFAVMASLAPPPSGQFRLELAHAAYAESQSVRQFNYYLVAPGAGISGATPTAVDYGAASAAANLPDGSYEIVVTDTSGKVVFDSGPKGVTLPLPSSNSNAGVVLIGALDASGGSVDGSPISLLALQNTGESLALFNGKN